uniref:JMY/WHAMM middle domain-containing protein n=1 Tax=Biomphalaria glabrata TaxID=6526 RepID=A0A2C9LML9_BIOGL
MTEVYRQDYEQKIVQAEEELKTIAFERDNCTVMKDLEDVYKREDEAVIKLISALADYYNYQLQPYLDSHSLATKKIQHYSQQISSPDVGERVKNESMEQHLSWACLLIEVNQVIQNLQVEHKSIIVTIFKGTL